MILEKCSDDFNNMMVRIESQITIRQSLELSPLIATAEKKTVLVQIYRIIEFFLSVTGKQLEDFQIKILATDLYDLFRTDTLDDVILMFKMARKGEFGKIYGFDSMVVMEWALQYLHRKSAERERLQKKQEKFKRVEEPQGKLFAELPPEMQEKFNSIGKPKAETPVQFLKEKATEAMTNEKFIRGLDDNPKKKLKFKKYL